MRGFLLTFIKTFFADIVGNDMAKPIEYIIELNAEQAKRLVDDLINPKPNAERDKFIESAKTMKLEIR
jgi:polyhydroxyalkanoate synthesis regulator phasin